MLKRLHNDDWGIETNCFVCEPTNDAGLRIPFFHDTDRDVVVADVELSRAFSGAPTLVHGGVTLAVLDEAMAWACIAVGGLWAVTTETTTRFDKAVLIDTVYRVEAEVVGREASAMTCRARVLGSDGTVRVEATARFTTLGEAQAVRFAGAAIADEHRSYLAGG
jgi:acyl-coenzyme A thioesterase PaaI-like protein